MRQFINDWILGCGFVVVTIGTVFLSGIFLLGIGCFVSEVMDIIKREKEDKRIR